MSNITAIDKAQRTKVFWDSVQPSVRPEIKNVEQYLKTVITDGVRTQNFLSRQLAEGMPISELYSEKVAKMSHSLMYGDAHKDAGSYRKTPTAATLVSSAAKPERISVELNLLQRQVQDLLKSANTPEKKCEVLAFAHARMHAIQPFENSNNLNRSFLILGTEELLQTNGTIVAGDFDSEEYRQALYKAIDKDDIRGLTGFIGSRYGITLSHTTTTPFRIKSANNKNTKIDSKLINSELELSKLGSMEL